MPEPVSTPGEPQRTVVSAQMSDLHTAVVTAHRTPDGHVALTLRNERGTYLVLRDRVAVLLDVLARAVAELRTIEEQGG